MKTSFWILLGLLLSGAIFHLAYSNFQEVAEASTGYNASRNGFLSWDYFFIENGLVWNGKEEELGIISMGHKIYYPSLITEIVLCLWIGFTGAMMIRDWFSRPKGSIGWLFEIGVPLMFLALFLQNVTLAGQNYRSVLVTALALTLVADVCFVVAFMRGRFVARFASVVLMLPTVFVVADFIRRAPHAFS